MTTIFPLLARVPLLALLVVVSVYLLLIGVFAVTAVYSGKPARRRAAADMVRALWIAGRREE
ncbi:hypothetical protein [Actinacidiphila soli]|uniref:hypothetical protein n=1 Tax=Actinacidiphila soli TaxID=2487275 RepID=UPI000FCAEAEC|nr:hypothetical protein [Actinacidiphila soli]